MNDRAHQLSDAREDERQRYAAQRRVVLREDSIRATEHLRMTERRDLTDREDETGFAPGSLI